MDSLSTSAATEDHVSMGGWAARKALRLVEHVEQGINRNGDVLIYTAVDYFSKKENAII